MSLTREQIESWRGELQEACASEDVMDAIDALCNMALASLARSETREPVTAEQLAEVKDQCEQGLTFSLDHNCPATYALSAIWAELFADAAPQFSTGNGNPQDLGNAGVPGPAAAASIARSATQDASGAYALPTTAEVEQTMKDAARYRWLRDHGPSRTIGGTASMSIGQGPYIRLDPPALNKFSGMALSGDYADAVIDEAMK